MLVHLDSISSNNPTEIAFRLVRMSLNKTVYDVQHAKSPQ